MSFYSVRTGHSPSCSDPLPPPLGLLISTVLVRLDLPPPSEVLVLLGRSLLLCWAAGAAPGTSTANLAVPSFAFLFLLAQVLGKAVNSNTISDCAGGRE